MTASHRRLSYREACSKGKLERHNRHSVSESGLAQADHLTRRQNYDVEALVSGPVPLSESLVAAVIDIDQGVEVYGQQSSGEFRPHIPFSLADSSVTI